ncbi:hypothetical protein [Polyangium mundeleinium]|uniref:Uncharacterized protein n=1 Tax=Polyangium mundeleinium TaxID=2995306 RepID=A0ABT5ELH0_9BACT|nr:hypothetical protein [Polyangium mundeleinium]MDC0742697.1 hypothetical protein [Polyangium mundeleinium]
MSFSFFVIPSSPMLKPPSPKSMSSPEDEKGRLLAGQPSDASSGLSLVKARNGPLRDAEKKAMLRARSPHAAKETTGEVDTTPEAP